MPARGDIEWLIELLSGSDPLQFQGDPGWELESHPATDPAGRSTARFRAHVSPGLIGIVFNEEYYDMNKLLAILEPMLAVQCTRVGDKDSDIFRLRTIANNLGTR